MKHFSTLCVFVFILTFSISSAQTNWTKYEGNPVLDPGPSGAWEDYTILPFSILLNDTAYHMWYGGYDGSKMRIGYATSSDGKNWKKYDGNPVLDLGEPGSWDDGGVRHPYVVYNDSMYQMWYIGDDGTTLRIGYATSTDGITWTKYEGNPVLENGPAGSWKESGVSGPSILFDGSTYHMWFGGWKASQITSIGYATSPDGITWTEYSSNPVLKHGMGTWDGVMVETPWVIFYGNTYHMWFQGRNTYDWWQWRIGYATSTDGKIWTKHEDNPIIPPSVGWDRQWNGFPSVLLNPADSLYEMWYVGGARDWDGHIGYATAPVSYEAIFEYTFLGEDSVKFTDKSIGIITDWLWDFDDGSTSIERNPVHAFELGEYTITLTVSGPYGFADTTMPIIFTDLEAKSNIPLKYTLKQNYPNPFNPKTVIRYALPVTCDLDLSIYNILGQKVATLVNKKQAAGSYEVEWDASGFASGVYFYGLQTRGFTEMRKMVLLR